MVHLLEIFKLIEFLEIALKGEDAHTVVSDVEEVLQKLKSIKADFESKDAKP